MNSSGFLLAVWPVVIDLVQIDCVDRVHHHPHQTSTYQEDHRTHLELSRNQFRSARPLAISGGPHPQITAGSYNLQSFNYYIIGLCLHNFK